MKQAKTRDKAKIATRILAGFLAGLMVLGAVGTLLYYLFTQN